MDLQLRPLSRCYGAGSGENAGGLPNGGGGAFVGDGTDGVLPDAAERDAADTALAAAHTEHVAAVAGKESTQ